MPMLQISLVNVVCFSTLVWCVPLEEQWRLVSSQEVSRAKIGPETLVNAVFLMLFGFVGDFALP